MFTYSALVINTTIDFKVPSHFVYRFVHNLFLSKRRAQTISELHVLCEGVKLKCKDTVLVSTDFHINPHYATKHFKCQNNKKKVLELKRQGKINADTSTLST